MFDLAQQGASTPPGYGSPRDSRGAAASNDERNDKSCRAVAAQLAGGFPKAVRAKADEAHAAVHRRCGCLHA